MSDQGQPNYNDSLAKKRVPSSKSTLNTFQAQQFGKLPPQALDLEEACLGALMLEKDALTKVIDILHPD